MDQGGGTQLVEWGGEAFALLAAPGLFWTRTRTLLITDPHFGKDATFRQAGIPVPGGTTAADLARLTQALHATRAARLLILGDFFHAAAGRDRTTLDQLAAWRRRHAALEIVLVRGNHDQHAGDPPCEWGIHCVEEPFDDGPLRFRHHPLDDRANTDRSRFVFAGHLHPAIRLSDVGGTSLSAPGFLLGQSVGLLPAFGGFTGTKIVRPRRGDRAFVVADGEVLEVRTASRIAS